MASIYNLKFDVDRIPSEFGSASTHTRTVVHEGDNWQCFVQERDGYVDVRVLSESVAKYTIRMENGKVANVAHVAHGHSEQYYFDKFAKSEMLSTFGSNGKFWDDIAYRFT